MLQGRPARHRLKMQTAVDLHHVLTQQAGSGLVLSSLFNEQCSSSAALPCTGPLEQERPVPRSRHCSWACWVQDLARWEGQQRRARGWQQSRSAAINVYMYVRTNALRFRLQHCLTSASQGTIMLQQILLSLQHVLHERHQDDCPCQSA